MDNLLQKENLNQISLIQNLRDLNKPDQFILAVVAVAGDKAAKITYVREPFGREPDFGVTSVNYKLVELLVKGEPPR